MIITGLSDAPIPWPTGRKPGRGGPPILIVFKGLARAVRKESNQAVAHHWGVTGQTVTAWRKALNVPATNSGSSKLISAHYQSGVGEKLNVGASRANSDPKRDAPRRAKIAAAKTGKPRPRHVVDAMAEAERGRPHRASTKAQMSETHKKRGTRPPWLNDAWTAQEDALLVAGKLSPAEVAERTGRTLTAVYLRRKKLGLGDLRRRKATT